MAISDEVLMEQFQSGDEEAFILLIKRYEKSLFNMIYRFVGHYQTAEDLYQETFLRLHRSVERYDPSQPFSRWLYRIAAHLCIDMLRRWGREKILFKETSELELDEQPHSPGLERESDPAKLVEGREIQTIIERALKTLSPEHRAVAVMKHFQGLTYQEIGKILHCSIGTVKSRMHYAMENLKIELKREGILEE